MTNQRYMFDNEAEQTARVVRLPTAAPRKVRQAARREERRKLRDQLPKFTGKYLDPWQRSELRRAEERRALLKDTYRSPELVLALTIYSILPPEERARAKSVLQTMASTLPDDSARVALALLGGGK